MLTHAQATMSTPSDGFDMTSAEKAQMVEEIAQRTLTLPNRKAWVAIGVALSGIGLGTQMKTALREEVWLARKRHRQQQRDAAPPARTDRCSVTWMMFDER